MPQRSLLAVVLAVAAVSLTPTAFASEVTIDIGRGPVDVFIPSSYDPEVAAPLLLLLHGYTATGAGQEAYMQFGRVAEAAGMIYLHPDGTSDLLGLQFWNATDACCDLFGSGVDDSGYLLDLIEAVESRLNVDPKRIYITGHSNGGFMSYRMACDHSEKIAAIASLAGATWLDDADCGATEPVHVLQIHGTDDDVILFDGNCDFFQCYPGAIDTAKTWAQTDACDRVIDQSSPKLDLDLFLPGAETLVGRVDQGCLDGGSVRAASEQTPAVARPASTAARGSRTARRSTSLTPRSPGRIPGSHNRARRQSAMDLSF